MSLTSALAPASGKPLAVIYCRVSTKDQANRGGEAEGFSIPAQREACLHKADNLGATVVAEFVDAGESARSANRPELQRMLRYVAEHRVNHVIVHKVDRLARSRVDDVEINLSLTRAGAQLVSCTENIDETPSGMLLHGIMSSIAEFYSRNLATEARKGMMQKAKGGGTISAAPFGYINVKVRTDEGREVSSVEVDPARGQWVRWIYDRYATGSWTAAMLREELEKKSVVTLPKPKRPSTALSLSNIHAILRNRYYVGVVKFDGVEYPGRHEALISEALFDRVQRVRTARHQSREKPRVHSHYLRGTLYCGNCGESLAFEQSRNRTGDLYDYFYCLGRQRLKNGCTFKATQAHVLEALVEDYWTRVTLPERQVMAIRQLVLDHLEHLLPQQSLARTEAERSLKTLKQQSERLLQAYYADAISVDQLKHEQFRITVARGEAEAALQRNQSHRDAVLDKLDHLCEMLRRAQSYYLGAPSSVRRELNQSVFTRLYVDDDEIVASDLSDAYAGLLSPDLQTTLKSERQSTLTADVRTTHLRAVPQSGDLRPRGQSKSSQTKVERLLSVERPTGRLPWEKKNPGPFEVRGSNKPLLVGLTGFEPATP